MINNIFSNQNHTNASCSQTLYAARTSSNAYSVFMGGENIADVLIITYVNRGGQRSHCSPKVHGGLTERKRRKTSLTAYYCYIFES